jgi:hypothetical protein
LVFLVKNQLNKQQLKREIATWLKNNRWEYQEEYRTIGRSLVGKKGYNRVVIPVTDNIVQTTDNYF